MTDIMNTIILTLSIYALLSATAACAEGPSSSGSVLDIHIAEVTTLPSTPTNLIVAVSFVNKSTNDLRLLDCFDPLAVFFAWRIKKEGGAPLSLPSAGKIAFGAQPLTYITIKPNTNYSINVDLTKFIREHGQSIGEGTYEISTSYGNQYGKDCVKGIFRSNLIRVTLKQDR